ncbi:membrane protein [Bacteroidia bacterium]|nr:membrane protein [Bacteroidia bacterium]
MKKHIIALSLAAVAAAAVSCSDFLDEKLYNRYDKSNYFSSIANLDMAVQGVYGDLQRRFTYGQAFIAYDNDTDVSFIDGIAVNSGNGWRDIAHYYIKNDADYIEQTWQLLYSGIEKANVVLENYRRVPTASEDDRKKADRLAAEAKFLRGLYHFDLVRFYGDVPLKTTASDLGQNAKITRTPRADVYAQIVTDMTEAIADLPWWNETGVANDGRVHKGAAMGMLARVQLYRGGYSLYPDGTRRRPDNYKDYYQAVLDITSELIASGRHELNPSFEAIFRNHCLCTFEPKESMFEVDFVYASNVVTERGGYVGSWNALYTAQGVYGRANAFIRTFKKFYDKFEAADLRRDVSIGAYQVTAVGARTAIANENSEQWGLGKWRREWQDPVQQLLNQNNTSLNYVLLRYSDVLLMRAEALNEINEGADASGERDKLVDQVRRRGYGKQIDAPDPTVDITAGMSKDDFLAYLQDERARELCFESTTRRMDLIRWNILGDKLKEAYDWCEDPANKGINVTLDFVGWTNFTVNCNELYPIPAREIRENPTLVPNNPGYGN